MRPDANQIALKAIRAILDSAQPFELTVDEKHVRCAVARGGVPGWPPIEGLSKDVDGPWPAQVTVECVWDGGRTTLLVDCEYWKTKRAYRMRPMPATNGANVRTIGTKRAMTMVCGPCFS